MFWDILQVIIWTVGIGGFIYAVIKQKGKQVQTIESEQIIKKPLRIPLSSYVIIIAILTTTVGWLINTFAPDNSLVGISFIVFMILATIGIIPVVIINNRYSRTIREQGGKEEIMPK